MDRLTFGISILQSLWWKRDRSTAAASAVACKRALVRAAGWGCSSVHGAQRPAPKTEGCWHPPTPSHLFLPPTHSSAGGEAHLQLYFPILFNREKKNHKKSGISVFRCRTTPKQPLPWKKITAFSDRRTPSLSSRASDEFVLPAGSAVRGVGRGARSLGSGHGTRA